MSFQSAFHAAGARPGDSAIAALSGGPGAALLHQCYPEFQRRPLSRLSDVYARYFQSEGAPERGWAPKQ